MTITQADNKTLNMKVDKMEETISQEHVEEEEEVIETSAEEFDEEITFQDGSLIIA